MRRQAAVLATACLLALGVGASTASAASPVTWSRSGGIAGVSDRLSIDADRHAVLTTRQGTVRRTVKRGEYAELLRLVRAAKLSTLKRVYRPKGRVADGFTTSVRYGGRTVTVEEGSQPPRRLSRALEYLSALASRLAR